MIELIKSYHKNIWSNLSGASLFGLKYSKAMNVRMIRFRKYTQLPIQSSQKNRFNYTKVRLERSTENNLGRLHN